MCKLLISYWPIFMQNGSDDTRITTLDYVRLQFSKRRNEIGNRANGNVTSCFVPDLIERRQTGKTVSTVKEVKVLHHGDR